MANLQNPVKAIRAKCLDCCCGSSNEVKQCTVVKCPLYPFRFGTNPYRTKRAVSADQMEKMREKLAMRRSIIDSNKEKTANQTSEGTYTTRDIAGKAMLGMQRYRHDNGEPPATNMTEEDTTE